MIKIFENIITKNIITRNIIFENISAGSIAVHNILENNIINGSNIYMCGNNIHTTGTNIQGILAAVLLMAVVTYIPRAFPMVFLRRKLKSEFLRSFLYYVPYAVLGAMIFPKIVYSTGNIYTALAGMIAALIMAYFNKGLMKVAISAILVVYISGLLFKLA